MNLIRFLQIILLIFTIHSQPTANALIISNNPKSIKSNTSNNQSSSLLRHPPSSSSSSHDNPNPRRSFITKSSFLLISLLTSSNPTQTNALQQRNEALCGTGFFQHFNEFKCTSIGDIEDEGKVKDMSLAEENAVDSLMGKLQLTGSSSSSDEMNGSFRDGVDNEYEIKSNSNVVEGRTGSSLNDGK